jgi:hypothetical protein
MAYEKAYQSLGIWLGITMLALITEGTILLLISLSTEHVDCTHLAQEYRELTAQSTREEEPSIHAPTQKGVSLKTLITQVASSRVTGALRIIRLSYASDQGSIELEGKTPNDLTRALTHLLMNEKIIESALIARTPTTATLRIAPWESSID